MGSIPKSQEKIQLKKVERNIKEKDEPKKTDNVILKKSKPKQVEIPKNETSEIDRKRTELKRPKTDDKDLKQPLSQNDEEQSNTKEKESKRKVLIKTKFESKEIKQPEGQELKDIKEEYNSNVSVKQSEIQPDKKYDLEDDEQGLSKIETHPGKSPSEANPDSSIETGRLPEMQKPESQGSIKLSSTSTKEYVAKTEEIAQSKNDMNVDLQEQKTNKSQPLQLKKLMRKEQPEETQTIAEPEKVNFKKPKLIQKEEEKAPEKIELKKVKITKKETESTTLNQPKQSDKNKESPLQKTVKPENKVPDGKMKKEEIKISKDDKPNKNINENKK